jgi:hypothetical protein
VSHLDIAKKLAEAARQEIFWAHLPDGRPDPRRAASARQQPLVDLILAFEAEVERG